MDVLQVGSQGKVRRLLYVPIKQEPELMYKLFNGIACNLTELLVLLNG